MANPVTGAQSVPLDAHAFSLLGDLRGVGGFTRGVLAYLGQEDTASPGVRWAPIDFGVYSRRSRR